MIRRTYLGEYKVFNGHFTVAGNKLNRLQDNPVVFFLESMDNGYFVSRELEGFRVDRNWKIAARRLFGGEIVDVYLYEGSDVSG